MPTHRPRGRNESEREEGRRRDFAGYTSSDRSIGNLGSISSLCGTAAGKRNTRASARKERAAEPGAAPGSRAGEQGDPARAVAAAHGGETEEWLDARVRRRSQAADDRLHHVDSPWTARRSQRPAGPGFLYGGHAARRNREAKQRADRQRRGFAWRFARRQRAFWRELYVGECVG